MTKHKGVMVKKPAVFLACFFSVTVLFHSALGGIVKGKGPVTESPLLEYAAVLTGSSGELLDGRYVMVFRVYDSLSSTVPLWEETHRVMAESGEIEVVLGQEAPLPSLELGTRYLGISIDGEELFPRYSLAGVSRAGEAWTAENTVTAGSPDSDHPHFRQVLGFDERYVNVEGPDSVTGSGTALPVLLVRNTAGGAALRGESSGSSSSATYGSFGNASNTSTGTAHGGYFTTSSSGTGTHYGVYAQGYGNSSGSVRGIYAQAGNTGAGEAVAGKFYTSSSGTGSHYGLVVDGYGTSSGRVRGIDVYADNTGSGETTAGRFYTSSSGSGPHTGVYTDAFANAANTVYGVDSWATNTGSGTAVGGMFQTDLDGTGQHYGVRAQAAADNSSSVYAVDGFAANYGTGPAYAGYFSTYTDGSGSHYGVYSLGNNISGDAYGTYSSAENSGSSQAYGGYFNTSSLGSGVHYGLYSTGYGASSGNVRGIYAYASNAGSGEAVGGRFQATSSGTGTHYGVYGIEAAGGTGAAVYASGDFAGSGAKYAVVKTSKGHRFLSVIESPEVWFEDTGEARLENGSTHIELDPLFLETVTIDSEHPMKVFIQLKDDCKGTYVKTATTGFDVFELQGGASNASFDFRVMAKRRGYENERLRLTDVGTNDPNLYPELRGEIEQPDEEEPQQQEQQRKLVREGEMGREEARRTSE